MILKDAIAERCGLYTKDGVRATKFARKANAVFALSSMI
jgi:hypothetical protein